MDSFVNENNWQSSVKIFNRIFFIVSQHLPKKRHEVSYYRLSKPRMIRFQAISRINISQGFWFTLSEWETVKCVAVRLDLMQTYRHILYQLNFIRYRNLKDITFCCQVLLVRQHLFSTITSLEFGLQQKNIYAGYVYCFQETPSDSLPTF